MCNGDSVASGQRVSKHIGRIILSVTSVCVVSLRMVQVMAKTQETYWQHRTYNVHRDLSQRHASAPFQSLQAIAMQRQKQKQKASYDMPIVTVMRRPLADLEETNTSGTATIQRSG